MGNIIESTASSLNSALKQADNIPLTPIPTPLLFASGETHKGMDYEMLTNKFLTEIGKLEPKIPIASELSNGEKSLMEQVEAIRFKCIIEHLMQQARIEVAIAPGATVVCNGANAGGPVVATGFNINFIKGNGTIA
jgi:hypothetical protein